METDERVDTRFRAMGTDVHVITLGGPAELGERARALIERLEDRWSRFRPESELCRLNAVAGRPVVVSVETFDLIALAVEAWRATAGRYDPTVLTALRAAGYDDDFAALARDRPEPVTATGPAPGCSRVVLDPVVRAVTLPPGVALDLGGIGKGRAADLVAADLLAAGAAGVCVNLGGDLRVGGAAPAPEGWVVEVEDLLDTAEAGVLVLEAGGVATSTRLRRTWTRAGTQLHHLLDPATGAPAATGLAAVTVLAGDACWAEVLAKAAFVAGPAEGARLLLDAGVTGLFLHDDGHFEELAGLDAFRP